MLELALDLPRVFSRFCSRSAGLRKGNESYWPPNMSIRSPFWNQHDGGSLTGRYPQVRPNPVVFGGSLNCGCGEEEGF